METWGRQDAKVDADDGYGDSSTTVWPPPDKNRWSSFWRMVISFWIRRPRCFSLGDIALRIILSEKVVQTGSSKSIGSMSEVRMKPQTPSRQQRFVVKSCNVMEWLGAKSTKMSYDSLDVCRSRAVWANGSLLNCLEKRFQWPVCVICLAVLQHVQDWRTIVSQILIFDLLIRKNMTGHCLTTDNAPIYTPRVVCGFIDK
jgi:hypothetical protein